MVVLDLPHTIFHYIVVCIAGLDLFSGRAKGELIDSCIGRPSIANVYLPVDDFSLIRNSKRKSRQNMSQLSGNGKMKNTYLGVSSEEKCRSSPSRNRSSYGVDQKQWVEEQDSFHRKQKQNEMGR